MENILIGNGYGRPSRRGESPPFRAMVLALTAWLLGGGMADSALAEVLRWKFKDGEVLHYSMEQKTVTNVKGMDRESKSTRSQTLDLIWKVNNVTSSGEAEITQRIDRVRFRVEGPPLMPFEFDSNNPKTDAENAFPEIAQMLKAMAGAEFTFRIKPNGEIADIKFSEQTLKALRNAAPPGAPEGEITEKALGDMLMQSSPPAFPDGPLEPGKTWTSKPVKVPIGVGTIVLERVFTFQGPDPKSPRLLLVGMETKVALEPAQGADTTAELRKQEGKGSLTFDAEAGHMVRTRGTQKIEMAITLMGQKIEQTTETTTSMSLAP
jgi:hypothetical protein